MTYDDKSPLELAQVDIKPGQAEMFISELETIAAVLRKASGCKGLSIYRSHEVPDRFRLLVRWDAIDDHLQFRKSEEAELIREIFARFARSRPPTEHLFQVYPVLREALSQSSVQTS